jgi:hypothetical protein
MTWFMWVSSRARAIGPSLVIALASCGGTSAHDAPMQAPAPKPKRLDEAALLRDLPGGNIALLGGHYDRLQSLMHTALGRLMDRAAAASGIQDQIQTLVSCARGEDVHVVGGLALAGSRLTVRNVTDGVRLSDLAACATRAGFSPHQDADGKYMAIEMTLNKVRSSISYLVLPDGVLYSRQAIGAGATAASRAELEADAANTKKTPGDLHLIELARRADRTKTVWFAGSGEGTPVAGHLGDVLGAIELDAGGGIRLDLTADLLDRTQLHELVRGYRTWIDAAKDDEDNSPAKGVSLREEGTRAVVTVRWTQAQLDELLARRSASDKMYADNAIAAMGEFADEMCACSDTTCAQRVSDLMIEWGKREAKQPGHHRGMKWTDDQQQAMSGVTKRLTDCMTQAMASSIAPP